MANEDHLAILRQGVTAWNQWREQNPETVPNLSGADLSKAQLQNANLKKAVFCKVELGKQVVRTQMSQADLQGADLSSADLRWVNLGSADLERAKLVNANLSSANLALSHLSYTRMSGADLSHADLEGSYFFDADLQGANLTKANIYLTNFTGANLQGASLKDTDIVQTQLIRTNLSQTNMAGAQLQFTSLNQADLRWANVAGADFSKSAIGATILAELDLREARGLEEIWHDSPSVVDFSTIYKSQGQIPEKFLLQVGVPREMIKIIQSMAGKLGYRNTYIAFSSADREFVDRLYDDLIHANVPCWRYGCDLQNVVAKRLHGGLEVRNRIWDRLVAVCSEKAFQQEAFIDEINKAVQLETQEKKGDDRPEFLFAICLDDATKEILEQHNLQDQMRIKVYDFKKWNDAEKYQTAFKTLLCDLTEKRIAGVKGGGSRSFE